MRSSTCQAFAVFLLLLPVVPAPASVPSPPPTAAPRDVASSLRFEPGPTGGDTWFTARIGGGLLALAPGEAVLHLSRPIPARDGALAAASSSGERPLAGREAAAVRLRFVGASPGARLAALDELPGKTNYFFGDDPTAWRTDVPGYARVRHDGLYPGIDLVYYGNAGELEYDFVVAAGTDPSRIRIAVDGADAVEIDPAGDLVIRTAAGDVRQRAPRLYQRVGGAERAVAGRYALRGDAEVGFEVGPYDPARPLVVDPAIAASTYLGGGGDDSGGGSGRDAAGNLFVGGNTTSFDFPTASPLFPSHTSSGRAAFVAKLDPTGSRLIYATYLGGSGDDSCFNFTVDSFGNAYLAGVTTSTNFPVTNAFQSSNGGGFDGFLVRLNPAGNAILYATYFGGSGFENSQGVAADDTGRAWLDGMTTSDNLPTRSANQAGRGGAVDGFVASFRTNLSGSESLVFATYFGGSGDDNGVFSGATGVVDGGIGTDGAGNAIVAGSTSSPDLPVHMAVQPQYGGNTDAFVAKYSPSGAIVYATYIGGSQNDAAFGAAADASGAAYAAMVTASTNFPVRNPIQGTSGGGFDAALVKIDPSGASVVYATYLGGSADESAQRVAVDPAGNAYTGGNTNSTNFPIKEAVQATFGGGGADAWVAEVSPTGSLISSTFLGGASGDVTLGLAADPSGVTVTGTTGSGNFPVGVDPFQSSLRGGGDAFVTRLVASSLVARVSWNAPTGDGIDPPTDLTAQVASAVVGNGAAPGAARPRAVVTGYKLYRASTPNVEPIPSNLFTTLPASQTSATAPLDSSGSFFVVTACYDDQESPPSNEAGAGQPGATITSLKVKASKIVAKGSGFTSAVTVFVDGIPFVSPASVKANKKVVQKGALLTGQTIGQYVTSGRTAEVAFLNSDQRLTRFTYRAP